MAEPAELLLIKDQYKLAFHALSRGLAAEEADKRSEALVYYRKGQQHLTQGLEIPTGGERHQGVVWDRARQLQQRMVDTLRNLRFHLSNLEISQQTTGEQRYLLLKDLPPNLYPDLARNSLPSRNSLHHLYPIIPAATQNTTPTPNTAPVRSAPPAVPHTRLLAAAGQGTVAMDNPGDQPPAYTPKPTDGHRSLAYSPSGGGLGSGKPSGAAAAGGDGSELLCIPSGVQLFFVEPNGQVSSLSYPGYLRIIAVNNQNRAPAAGNFSVFLQVCGRLYQLTADTPVLLANSGIFMFPDSLAETPGSYVGIVLSSELPVTDREIFQDLLSQLTQFRVQGTEGAEGINLSTKVPLGPMNEKEKPPLPGWSEKMSRGILSGATQLSQSFAKGAEATGIAIQKGAAKIRDRITPEETPSEVSPRVTKGLNMAKQTTGGAVRVSQFLVNGVSTVAGHIADKVAPHVKKHGAKLVPESLKKSQDGRASNLDGAKFVAASSVQGFSAIWSSLETGAKHVCKSVATETVTTVKYKYGEDAGQATDTGLQSVANIGLTAYNIDNLGIKSLLKTTGKQTAKAMAGSQNGQAAETEGKEVQKGQHAHGVEKEELKKEKEKKK